jgi:hypothetical protein
VPTNTETEEMTMTRLFRRALTLAILCASISFGCESAHEDSAAKWDGTQPLTPIPAKASKNPKKSPPTPVKKVRGFTVPAQ